MSTETSDNLSTCPNCEARAPFGTFADLGECPGCEEPLTTLCRMATDTEAT